MGMCDVVKSWHAELVTNTSLAEHMPTRVNP